MELPNGMTESTFDRYIVAMVNAGINPAVTAKGGKRLVQTITVGNGVEASAGTHDEDGRDKSGRRYTAAFDISTRHDLSKAKREKLQIELWKQGIACWYRDWYKNEHIHAVDCNVPMKKSLRAQIHSFLKKENGLKGSGPDAFVKKYLTKQMENTCRTYFLKNNRAVGIGNEDDVNEMNYAEFLDQDEDHPCSCGEPLDEDGE